MTQFKTTTSNAKEDPVPIETVEVTNAEMAQLKIDYLAALDKTPYVVCNVEDVDNKTYYEWTGSTWVPWNDLNQLNRWCIPANQIETFNLTSDVGDMGETGEPIVFTDKDTLAIVRLVPNTNNWDITGMVAPSSECENKRVVVQNVSNTFQIRLRNNNGGSAAANRFLFKQPIQNIAPNEAIVFGYDDIDQRWRAISIF